MTMATGDLHGAVAGLRRALKAAGFTGHFDEVGLRLGEPHAALPLLHYVLLETSAHVRARALEAGVTLAGKADAGFVEGAFRLACGTFGVRTRLTPALFLKRGYAELRAAFVADALAACRAAAACAARQARLRKELAARPSAERLARAHKPAEVRVQRAGAAPAAAELRALPAPTATDGAQTRLAVARRVEPCPLEPQRGGCGAGSGGGSGGGVGSGLIAVGSGACAARGARRSRSPAMPFSSFFVPPPAAAATQAPQQQQGQQQSGCNADGLTAATSAQTKWLAPCTVSSSSSENEEDWRLDCAGSDGDGDGLASGDEGDDGLDSEHGSSACDDDCARPRPWQRAGDQSTPRLLGDDAAAAAAAAAAKAPPLWQPQPAAAAAAASAAEWAAPHLQRLVAALEARLGAMETELAASRQAWAQGHAALTARCAALEAELARARGATVAGGAAATEAAQSGPKTAATAAVVGEGVTPASLASLPAPAATPSTVPVHAATTRRMPATSLLDALMEQACLDGSAERGGGGGSGSSGGDAPSEQRPVRVEVLRASPPPPRPAPLLPPFSTPLLQQTTPLMPPAAAGSPAATVATCRADAPAAATTPEGRQGLVDRLAARHAEAQALLRRVRAQRREAAGAGLCDHV